MESEDWKPTEKVLEFEKKHWDTKEWKLHLQEHTEIWNMLLSLVPVSFIPQKHFHSYICKNDIR